MSYVSVAAIVLLLLIAAIVVRTGSQTVRDVAAWEVGLVAGAASDECACGEPRAVMPGIESEGLASI